MTPEERTALLDLWPEVPECKPPSLGKHLRWSRAINRQMEEALARDAMVEWLIEQSVEPQFFRRDGVDYLRFKAILPAKEAYTLVKCPTSLLALIAAVRAVKGGKS